MQKHLNIRYGLAGLCAAFGILLFSLGSASFAVGWAPLLLALAGMIGALGSRRKHRRSLTWYLLGFLLTLAIVILVFLAAGDWERNTKTWWFLLSLGAIWLMALVSGYAAERKLLERTES